jgi:hypothetical protein
MFTKTLTVVQEVHVSRRQTIVRTWYDIVYRTIECEIDTNGKLVSQGVVSEETEWSASDLEDEIVEDIVADKRSSARSLRTTNSPTGQGH